MNPAHHPPQHQLPYGGPAVSGYGQPPTGHAATNQGYGPPTQRGYGNLPGPPPLGPGGVTTQSAPLPQALQTQAPATVTSSQLGFSQFSSNGPSPQPPMSQGPPVQGQPLPGFPAGVSRPIPPGPGSGPPLGSMGGPQAGSMTGPPSGHMMSPSAGLPSGPAVPQPAPPGPPRGPPLGPAGGQLPSLAGDGAQPSDLAKGPQQGSFPSGMQSGLLPRPGPQQQFSGPPQANSAHLTEQMSGMNLGGIPPRQGGALLNQSSPLSPQSGEGKNITGQFPPRPAPNVGPASFPASVNGGPAGSDYVGGSSMPQDAQTPWNPNAQSPSHTSRPPLPQTGTYMNGMPGQPLVGGNMVNGPSGYQGAPPMPGQYHPRPGMGYPQQPSVPGSHMNKGYPPAPGSLQSPQYGAPPGGAFPGQQQKQQPKRLDPAHLPSQVQFMKEDQENNGGVYNTLQQGRHPPLATTDFIVQDQGYCSPRFIRSSVYSVPTTVDMIKQTKVPLALILSPMAETRPQEIPPPVVDMGDVGPVRCVRCKAYMCPLMQFIDGGRRFHCLFCKATTEVPPDYFQHLDHTGMRVDRFERPELVLGAYEFVATKEYCRNTTFPKPPALIFCIDVSYNNIKSGMVHLLCSHMKELLKLLPIDTAVNAQRTNMRVGFITYNNTVHFYNIKSCLAQPQMMVVGDVQEMFMPLLDGFLCDPEESASVIDALMEQIPAMFGETRETETILAPAIQAGMEALKAADCAGKLLVFHSSLPIAEAPGKLKNRDDRKLLGTDKEKTVLTPQNNTYNNLGQECVPVGCSVDLFIFNNSYIDIATIGQVARLTGGEVYKYTYFQADIDGERLIADLRRNISRPIAFDAVMRVRTSTGIRATDFYGHFFMSNTTDMELASIDSDKGVAVEIKHDDKLTEDDGVYVQVALLYTSCGGQRRLRVLNLGLKACSQMADVFKTCDLNSVINYFSKLACYKLLEHSPKQVKDDLIHLCAQLLASYRKNCASPSPVGQLVLPETMKLLPLYLNCLLKNDALSGGSDMTIDDRSFVMQAVMTLDVPSSVVFFYPQLIPIHNVNVNDDEVPFPIRCSVEFMESSGVYLLENGIHMFMWIGQAASPEWLQGVFGVMSAAQIETERPFLPELDTPLSHRVRKIVRDVRSRRHRCMRLTLVRQQDKMEMVMKHFLAEDRGVDGSLSYVDFLCHMHKEIRNLLE